ncbi:BnaUnng03610D, partial [Brassica napus]
HSNVSRTGLIGESSHTYVSRTGFRRRSGAICGGGIEIQASHPIDLAPLPVEGEAEGGRGGTRRRRLRRDIV